MDRSDFLFATPSMLTGFSRGLDMGATLSDHSYNTSSSPTEADTRASTSDWLLVGYDLDDAIEAYENSESDKTAA